MAPKYNAFGQLVEDTSSLGVKSNPLLQDSVIDSADMFGSKALNTKLNDAVTNGISSKKVFGQLGNTAVSPTVENAAISGTGAMANGFSPNMNEMEFARLAEIDPAGAAMYGQAGVTFDANGNQTGAFSNTTGKDDGFFGLGNDNVKSAIGLGQLGLGVAGYFQKEGIYKAQKDLLNQNLSDARDESAAKKGVRRQLGAAYGG